MLLKNEKKGQIKAYPTKLVIPLEIGTSHSNRRKMPDIEPKMGLESKLKLNHSIYARAYEARVLIPIKL